MSRAVSLRRLGWWATAIVVAVLSAACGDPTTAPDRASPVSLDPGAEPASTAEAQIRERLSDPFVIDLLGHLGNRGVARRLDSDLRMARTRIEAGEPAGARTALTGALDLLHPRSAESEGAEDVLHLDVLELVLRDVVATITPEGAVR